jgi:predicted Zn-dependent protease
MRRLSCIMALVLALAAPTPPAQAKTKMTALPPYAGAYQPQSVDERGLWMEADEDERELRDSKFVLHDPALQAFVGQVLCKAVGEDRCKGVRIYIVRVPYFNASMTPNGTMRVYTGLLLRMRNEAELAGILGHEFGHFEERHSLANFRTGRLMTDIASWALLFGNSGIPLYNVAIGTMYQFGRDEERRADLRAFGYLSASSYRPGAFPDVWDREMDEADATATGRSQRSSRYERTPFFASHPTSLERSTYLRKLAVEAGDEGDDGAASYQAALAQWRPQFLDDQLKLNDFGGTEYLLGQLARDGWTPDLLFARGELYRLRGNPRDLVSATEFYREALAKGAADPLLHRSLGMTLLRSRMTAEGSTELKRYLALRPDASDASMIATLIEQSSTQ